VADAEPGWYDDGHGKHRWWDGARWTDEYIDLAERDTELHTGAAQTGTAAGAGWYDDGRGRLRWWDGSRWTDASRFSGTEQTFAGVVVDGRWIHFGALSQPVAGAVASCESGAELLRRGRLSKPAVARALHGPVGLITPRTLPRAVHGGADYLVVSVSDQVWLAPVPPGQKRDAERFASWINSSAEHYRYR
jgi:hypothetical protein